MPDDAAQRERCDLVNAVPQAPRLNRGIWARIEERVRRLALIAAIERGFGISVFPSEPPSWRSAALVLNNDPDHQVRVMEADGDRQGAHRRSEHAPSGGGSKLGSLLNVVISNRSGIIKYRFGTKICQRTCFRLKPRTSRHPGTIPPSGAVASFPRGRMRTSSSTVWSRPPQWQSRLVRITRSPASLTRCAPLVGWDAHRQRQPIAAGGRRG